MRRMRGVLTSRAVCGLVSTVLQNVSPPFGGHDSAILVARRRLTRWPRCPHCPTTTSLPKSRFAESVVYQAE